MQEKNKLSISSGNGLIQYKVDLYTELSDYLEQFESERSSIDAKPKTMQPFSSIRLLDHSSQLPTQKKDLNIMQNVWDTRVNTI